jgi:hypothetical protein
VDLPAWWEWELELTPHVEQRMEERGFSEVELRMMLERATDLLPDRESARWEVRTHHGGAPWTVILEIDEHDERIVVVTAYPRQGLR